MTTWSDVRKVLFDAMVLASELPEKHMTWSEAASTGWATEPQFSLNIIASDEIHNRPLTDPVGVSSVVEFTLSVKSESISTTLQSKGGPESGRLLAFDALEHLRQGRRRPAIQTMIRAAKIAWLGDSGIKFVPYAKDGRTISCYHVDLFMRAEIYQAPREVAGTTIEHVQITGTIPDPPRADITVPIVVDRP